MTLLLEPFVDAETAEDAEMAHLRAEVRALGASSLRWRRRVSRLGEALCGVAVLAILGPLLAVVGYTIERGIGAWSVGFFTHVSAPMGMSGGGILNAIVGSGIIVGIASAGAVPAGILAAVLIGRSSRRLAGLIRFGVDVMAGVPAIMVGIFAYILIVEPMRHFSAFSASVALGLVMLPTVIRTAEGAVRGLPELEVEAARALGATRFAVLWRVVLRGALPGVATGVLLAVAGALGEAAPLLLTAIGNSSLSASPFGPMAALPLLVYQDGIQGVPSLQNTAWGTSLALLVLVIGLSALGRFAAGRIAASKRRASIPSPIPPEGRERHPILVRRGAQ